MNNFVTNLDSILDTKLALVNFISPGVGDRCIENKKYYTRKNENIDIIPNTIINSFFKNRKKSLLKFSLPTGIIPFINLMLTEVAQETAEGENITIYVNTHPYNLKEEEVLFIHSMLTKQFPAGTDIEYVSLSYDELSPEWINKKNIGYILNHDGYKWVEYHMAKANLFKTPLTAVTMYLPGIYDTGELNLRNILKHTIIDIEFLDAVIYSANIKVDTRD